MSEIFKRPIRYYQQLAKAELITMESWGKRRIWAENIGDKALVKEAERNAEEAKRKLIEYNNRLTELRKQV